MNILVGDTGFVGSNIWALGEMDLGFHSSNIKEAYGLNPDLLVYAGLRAEKYLANQAPELDMERILEAEENIRKINPKHLVLISTVDVYKNPNRKNEEDEIEIEGLHAYGYNRYVLEQWVQKNYPDALIVRLPGLFGKNIKKNFIYDMIHIVPFMLKEGKMKELLEKQPILSQYYTKQDNGFFKCNALSDDEKRMLKQVFLELGFSALNFTDSRNVYQFYPLNRLWNDIKIALKKEIHVLNIATEPISAAELYQAIYKKEFMNVMNTAPVLYDFRTKWDFVFGGNQGYIMNKEAVIKEIQLFMKREV